MKIQQKKHNPKKYIGIIISIFFVISFILGLRFINSFIAQKTNNTLKNEITTKQLINLNNPTEDQKNTGDNIKKNSIDNSNKTDQQNQINITITSINQTNDQLQIRSIISTVDINGTCTLTMNRNNNTTITKTVKVQALPNATTCMGFDVPKSDLSSGPYTIKIVYTNNSSVGVVEKIINVD